MALRSLGLPIVLAACLPLSAGADAPRFQTFATTDPDAPAHAFRVSDDGCTLLIRESPDEDTGPYHRLREERVLPLRDLAFGRTIQSAGGLSGSGDRVVGVVDYDVYGGQSFVLEDGIAKVDYAYEYPPTYRNISGDGSAIVGRSGYTRVGLRLGPLAGALQPGPGKTGAIATAVSHDGAVAAGYSHSPREATRWDANAGDVPELLGVLPDETESEALGVSGDGSTVVGRSGARAFRWQGGVMQDLGPGEALAANHDGSVVLGDRFLWDAANGRRPLVEALESDFGVDLSAWASLTGGDLSPDGLSVVGSAALPGGTPRAFRARLRPDGCPGPTLPRTFPLVTPEILGDWYYGLGASTGEDGTTWVSDYHTGRIWHTRERRDPDDPWTPPELLFEATPELGRVFVTAVGPGGEAYLGTSLEQFHRLDPDGTLTHLFDASGLPKPTGYDPVLDLEVPLDTQGIDGVVAPDGSVFVAAVARALRIDPDGSVSNLFDSDQYSSWLGTAWDQIFSVALLPDGRLLWLGSSPSGGAVTDAAGGLLEVMDTVADAETTPDGGLFTFDAFDWRVHYAPPGGADQLLTLTDDDGNEYDDFPTGGPHMFSSDGNGNLFTTAGFDNFTTQLVRIAPDGHVEPVVETSCCQYQSSGLDSISFAKTYQGAPALLQAQVSAPPVACTNGFDDDGDGRIDFEDPGCQGADDPSERSDALPCDDGEDDDGDGLADFPDDPGCASWTAPTEAPECSDGEDNDSDGLVDWDGAGLGAPDPQCAGLPSGSTERGACGLGFELGLLALAARAWRRRRRAPQPSPA